MFQKTFALTVRSLRVDSRLISPHLMRMGLGVLVLLFVYSTQHDVSAQAPGRDLFGWIIYSNASFATLIIPLMFATAITEEKEERMLPLLQIANVSPLTILVGKAIPQLLSVLVIFSVQLPFCMLAITLGGVSLSQVIVSYLAVAAYIIFIGFLSLWCSVALRHSANSTGLAGLLVLFYHVLPPIAYGIFATLGLDPGWRNISQAGIQFLGKYWQTNIFVRLNEVLATGFSGTALSWQVGTNLLYGLFFFLLSWLTFNYFNQESDSAPAKKVSITQAQGTRRRRSWQQALIWKEFYYEAGGTFQLVTKLVVYGMIGFLIAFAAASFRWDRIELREFAPYFGGMMLFFFLPIELMFSAARMFQPEIKNQTLSSLMILPISTRRICYSKIAGEALGLIPVLFYSVLSGALSPSVLQELFSEFQQNPVLFFVISANIIGNILLFLHLIAALSLRMNRWWAIFCAMLVIYFGYLIFAVLFGIVNAIFNFTSIPGSGTFYAMLNAFISLGLTVVLHFYIGRELVVKAAES